MHLPFDPSAAGPFDPLLQRGQYARQRFLTLDDLLLEQRIIFLSYPISNVLADDVIKKLLYLQYENKTAEIHLYINSPGGSVSATLAIYDTMQFLDVPVYTYCMGIAASGAAVLLAAGSKGKRYALPNSKVMVHQPYGQVGGQVSDIVIQANEILMKHTGKSLDQIERDTDRDNFMSSQEAKEYGLIDGVLERMPETMTRSKAE